MTVFACEIRINECIYMCVCNVKVRFGDMEIYAIENRPRKSKAAPRRMRSRFRFTLQAENRFPVFYASLGTLFLICFSKALNRLSYTYIYTHCIYIYVREGE